MGFLRRLLGGERTSTAADDAEPDAADPAPDDEALDAEVLRTEDARLDELRLRQVRFARYAWRPPAQGGTRRADDGPAGGANEER